jgi:hypothetical protein
MNSITDQNIKEDLHKLAGQSPSARAFFEWLAARERDSSQTTTDRICGKVGITKDEALTLMKRLNEIGVADLKWGRRGAKTRLEWNYSCSSVGEVALEPLKSLHRNDDTHDDDDFKIESSAVKSEILTIRRAKELLAVSLGVKESDIEIIVRG